MKKKNIIIIVSVAVVLAGIITAYFTVPVSYAGTSEREAVYFEVSEFKILLPVESQARQVMVSGSDSAKLGEIAHSDFPFQTYENYRKSKGVE